MRYKNNRKEEKKTVKQWLSKTAVQFCFSIHPLYGYEADNPLCLHLQDLQVSHSHEAESSEK